MNTELKRISFLWEAEAELSLARDTKDNIEAVKDLPPYITNYIGSKQKLVDWIWVHTPDGVTSVLDAFSGSAVVGYMYKAKGLRVMTNDRMRYCSHIARAIIENNSVTVSDEELENLLKSNPKAGDFVQETFRGKFFQSGVHQIIDNVRENVNYLKGFKKDIALFALGKTCISSSGSYGHFASISKGSGNRHADTPNAFTDRFRGNIVRINSLVFDNGKENKAFCKDILEVLPDSKVDLAYFDPPYATEYSTTNYETSYHFIEGLMTYWKGLEIDESSRVKKFLTDHKTVTQSNSEEFFDGFLNKAKGIKHWIISYRDHAYPNEAKMKKLIEKQGKSSRMFSRDHSYSMAGQNRSGEASHGKEHIFVCSTKIASKADLQEDQFMTVADLHGEAAKDSDARVTAFMGSKHDMLDWIWKYTPEGVKSVLDLFSGGANVGYFYKKKGLRVISNDLLDYPYHIARAVIENSSVTISDEEIEALLEPNSSAGDFILKTFNGYYYTKAILEFLENAYAHIQQLKGYKKDIALFALGRVCQIRACFGEYSRSKKSLTEPIPDDSNKYADSHLGNPSTSEFKKLFVKCIKDANALVFDNGQKCKVYRQDALSLINKVNVDVVYADPPYMTQFGFNDYEDKMHFIEGLMSYWKGKEILDNKRRNYASKTKYNKDSINELIQGFIQGSARNNAQLLMSYRDKAFPTAAELKEMFGANYNGVDFRRRAVSYGIARYAGEGPGRDAQEYLIIASKPKKQSSTKASDDISRNCQTSLTGDIISHDGMFTEAEAQTPAGEQKFTFILTHAGTNLNGDHFTVDELQNNHESAINTKIDLKHSQDLTDIVGGVTEARFKDADGGHVECDGELYTEDNPFSRLAYKLISKGIVKQVSMECDYEEGECSVCGKRIKSKKNYCVHLKKYKGREYQGKQVFEILHNITFTGMGLLDRKGADPGAKILSVAKNTLSIEDNNMETIADFQSYLTAKKINEEVWPLTSAFEGYVRQLLKKFGSDDINSDDLNSLITSGLEIFSTKVKGLVDVAKSTAANNASAGVEEDLKKVQQENETLKKQVEDLQKQIETFETEKRNAERKSLASKLIETWEQRGRTFKDETERTAEIERLAGLDEGAFDAAKSVIDALPENKAEGTQHRKKVMRSDAGIEPMAVDDKTNDLAVRLGNGLREAREAKVE
jgi:adenine-specific DNA methylase